MHSNVVTLASSIDEVQRKADLALALMGGGNGAALPGGGVVGEVLRLGEEVMGVRATVQGLRMQMHNLMMGNVGVPVGGGPGGVNMGFGRPHLGSSAAEEGGGGDGLGIPSITQGIPQRPFYGPVAPGMPGITKL